MLLNIVLIENKSVFFFQFVKMLQIWETNNFPKLLNCVVKIKTHKIHHKFWPFDMTAVNAFENSSNDDTFEKQL